MCHYDGCAKCNTTNPANDGVRIPTANGPVARCPKAIRKGDTTCGDVNSRSYQTYGLSNDGDVRARGSLRCPVCQATSRKRPVKDKPSSGAPAQSNTVTDVRDSTYEQSSEPPQPSGARKKVAKAQSEDTSSAGHLESARSRSSNLLSIRPRSRAPVQSGDITDVRHSLYGASRNPPQEDPFQDSVRSRSSNLPPQNPSSRAPAQRGDITDVRHSLYWESSNPYHPFMTFPSSAHNPFQEDAPAFGTISHGQESAFPTPQPFNASDYRGPNVGYGQPAQLQSHNPYQPYNPQQMAMMPSTSAGQGIDLYDNIPDESLPPSTRHPLGLFDELEEPYEEFEEPYEEFEEPYEEFEEPYEDQGVATITDTMRYIGLGTCTSDDPDMIQRETHVPGASYWRPETDTSYGYAHNAPSGPFQPQRQGGRHSTRAPKSSDVPLQDPSRKEARVKKPDPKKASKEVKAKSKHGR